MDSTRYESAEITETYAEIWNRCDGEFENTDLYDDIIQRQIEKVFISSRIDEEYEGVRQQFRLYPVMLLYKVLLELGRCTGEYRVSMPEYRYLVATTKVYEDYLDTLLLIKLFREENTAAGEFEGFKSKFDNRLLQALKLLPALSIERDSIALKDEFVEEVAKKVFLYERNPRVYAGEAYIDFLCSIRPLIEPEQSENYEEDEIGDTGEYMADGDGEIDESARISTGENILLYGVPGAGKSWTIEHEYCDDDACMERLVFHPDYMHSDFVGQIMPVVENGSNKVTYRFVPGPFTKIVKKAYENPTKSYFLVIEEINRGNAPAIFGEIFQLLDRRTTDGEGFKKCTSEYGITNPDIARELY
ncbi:MAG: AAA family ATPase, partial [Acetatifactor sp.]|nr:AAA family ATPase [Acetatifactor sp.]